MQQCIQCISSTVYVWLHIEPLTELMISFLARSWILPSVSSRINTTMTKTETIIFSQPPAHCATDYQQWAPHVALPPPPPQPPAAPSIYQALTLLSLLSSQDPPSGCPRRVNTSKNDHLGDFSNFYPIEKKCKVVGKNCCFALQVIKGRRNHFHPVET